MLRGWLVEAKQQGELKDGAEPEEIATLLVVALNGAAPLFAASRDPAIWRQTLAQLRGYLQNLRKEC